MCACLHVHIWLHLCVCVLNWFIDVLNLSLSVWAQVISVATVMVTRLVVVTDCESWFNSDFSWGSPHIIMLSLQNSNCYHSNNYMVETMGVLWGQPQLKSPLNQLSQSVTTANLVTTTVAIRKIKNSVRRRTKLWMSPAFQSLFIDFEARFLHMKCNQMWTCANLRHQEDDAKTMMNWPMKELIWCKVKDQKSVNNVYS